MKLEELFGENETAIDKVCTAMWALGIKKIDLGDKTKLLDPEKHGDGHLLHIEPEIEFFTEQV